MASQQQKKDNGCETSHNGGQGQDPIQQLLQVITAVCCVGVGTGCTVKTPLSGYGRGEWDCRCNDIGRAIPMLVEAGAPEEILALTAEGLIPVCGARFTRHAGTIDFAGSVLEIALDSGVLMGGGKEIPLCEVEVELKSGDPETAIAFGMELKRYFALVPQGKSKFRRALELAQGE